MIVKTKMKGHEGGSGNDLVYGVDSDFPAFILQFKPARSQLDNTHPASGKDERVEVRERDIWNTGHILVKTDIDRTVTLSVAVHGQGAGCESYKVGFVAVIAVLRLHGGFLGAAQGKGKKHRKNKNSFHTGCCYAQI